MPGQRGYVSGNHSLELGSQKCGWLYSSEGGMPTTEVVLEKLGPDHELHKHISGLKYEDITLTFGTGMSEGFWAWIQSSFNRNYQRKDGAIVAADYDFKEMSRLSFYDAMITELNFPGLDASSKDTCKATVKLTPEYTESVAKGTTDYVRDYKYQARQHRWSPANFRLNIDGLDCTRVYKIEPLTLRQKLVDYVIGEDRGVQKEPAQIEYPNLAITIPESQSDKFYQWYKDFVVTGNCSESGEKTGTLEYLNQSLDKTLFQLNFYGLGIYKVTPDKAEAGSESIRRVKFEMYSERIDFKYNSIAYF